MRKMKLFLTALAVMISSMAFAQSLTVTGTVTDGSTGEPVPFASVHEVGTMNGVSTDFEGNYSIVVSKNATLSFSSIGYQEVSVAVDGNSKVNCVLPVDAEMLETAVAVGYGSAKKVGTMVGSVTTVKSDAIKNAPSSSALDALQGQVAVGVVHITINGATGNGGVRGGGDGGQVCASVTAAAAGDGVILQCHSAVAQADVTTVTQCITTINMAAFQGHGSGGIGTDVAAAVNRTGRRIGQLSET